MIELTGSNGAKIKIGTASFKDAMALKSAIMRELAKTGISLEAKKIDLETEIGKDLFNSILKPLAMIDSSPEFYDAVFKCANKCTYNGERITEELFEKEENREDYYLVVLEIVKVNLSPFLKGLVSGLPRLTKGLGEIKAPE